MIAREGSGALMPYCLCLSTCRRSLLCWPLLLLLPLLITPTVILQIAQTTLGSIARKKFFKLYPKVTIFAFK